MNASIPDSLRDFVLSRVAEGGYASIDDYVGGLVEADRERLAQNRLEEEIVRGLSGEPVPVTPDDFDRLRAEIRARHAQAPSGNRR